MKKINHLWEAVLGFIIPIPTIFIEDSIEIIKATWPKTFFWKWLISPLSIIGLKFVDFIFLVLGILILIDAIQGLFTEESIIPKIKSELLNLIERN